MHVDERVIWALRLSRAGQAHAPRVDRPSALHCSAPPPRCHILLHNSSPSGSRFTPEGCHRFEMTGAGSRPEQMKALGHQHMLRQRQRHRLAPRSGLPARQAKNARPFPRAPEERAARPVPHLPHPRAPPGRAAVLAALLHRLRADGRPAVAAPRQRLQRQRCGRLWRPPLPLPRDQPVQLHLLPQDSPRAAVLPEAAGPRPRASACCPGTAATLRRLELHLRRVR